MARHVEGRQVDGPLGGLPATQRVLLTHAQIDVALVEIRYSASMNLISSEQGLEIQGVLSDNGVVLPRLHPAQKQQVALNLGPTGPISQVEVQARGWQYFSGDNNVVMTIMPDAIAIQTSSYERWSVSMGPLVTAGLRAVEKILAPELVQRIGLRYVNRLVDESAMSPQAWADRIDPKVLGPVLHDVFGPRLVATQQQMELRLGESEGALVRHGSFMDAAARGATSYLVDTDVFTNETDKFSVDDMLASIRQLNLTALSLFQQIVTPEYRDKMGPVVPESSSD